MERATPAASAKPGATSPAPAAAPKTDPNRPNAVALPGAATTASAPIRPTPAKPAGAVGSPATQPSSVAPAKTEATAAQKPNAIPPKAGATAPNAEAPKQTAAAPARPAPAASAPALPTIWDLPYSTRKDLPAIELSMHVYSADPKQRFVVIKGERRVEGDDVSDDLVLREIRQDGIVLEFKGQRFFYPSTGR
jgi:general secretion pathway protein B